MIKKILTLVVLAFSVSTHASIINLSASIDGDQANAGMGTGSAGTGTAIMTLDDVTNSFSWTVDWSGLAGDVTVAHFHGPALTNQNAGVEVPISTLFNPSSGSAIIDALQSADLLAGLWYINIHTTVNPGGEIRGRVSRRQGNVVPIPATLALFGLGLAGLGWSRRKKA